MLIIKKPNKKILKKVAKQLRAGAVVVYPTDTAYALGCDATNAKAAAKIFKIKGRDPSKALPIIVADMEMAKKFFVLLPTPYSLLTKKHWPGPLSVVINAKREIVRRALKQGTAAVRVPDSLIARALSKYADRPLIATSANISYQPTCYSVKAYLRQINVIARSPSTRLKTTKQSRGDRRARYGSLAMTIEPHIVLDAGALRRRAPSTIVKVNDNGEVEVLRKGPVRLDIRY